MIKNYAPYRPNGTHIIRATFMMWDFVGHIAYRLHTGSSLSFLGLESLISYIPVLDNDVTSEYLKIALVENDCQFECDDATGSFSCTLKNDHGGVLVVKGDAWQFMRIITCMEIEGFEPEKNEREKQGE